MLAGVAAAFTTPESSSKSVKDAVLSYSAPSVPRKLPTNASKQSKHDSQIVSIPATGQ